MDIKMQCIKQFKRRFHLNAPPKQLLNHLLIIDRGDNPASDMPGDNTRAGLIAQQCQNSRGIKHH